ncbi:uncharacterized protein LOC118421057 isoform X1 [Branchiostoma floridae]|uniref:Uncharacterized protein LOC118421057 isoform X1 n=1 Tax=Branchiostoma floridae TaxID=7739 RepID=A0A9J7LJI0_BRAFL|nr:uncharacterized protein LOC118421057 isoform X1 [Branchiostoma floridae]
MKGLVFVIAVAFACCVATCGALECRTCAALGTRQDCLNRPESNCTIPDPVCMTTYKSVAGVKGWSNNCSPRAGCEAAKLSNHLLCKKREVFTCVTCCTTDGCVGDLMPSAASAARISIVTMATAALAVLLKNAAGF